MKYWLLILLSSSCLTSYDPWYTGPFFGTTSSNSPAGTAFFQPALIGADFYGAYNNKGSLHKKPSLYELNYSVYLQFGLFKTLLDATVIAQGFSSFIKGRQKISWGDTTAGLGIHLATEDMKGARPEIRLLLDLIIPSGKYNSLDNDLEGRDGVGKGSWTFSPIFVMRKSFAQESNHPFKINLNLNYSLGTTTTVRGVSIYGGSQFTRGAVKPGNQALVNLSLECSLTQKWVFVLENIYQHAFKSTFSGQTGGGQVGWPASNLFSMAPELEYNVSKNYGWIGGFLFSATGNNAPAFVGFFLAGAFSF